jgi:hypothetical protein
MIKINSNIQLSLLIAAIAATLSCIGNYNPFSDLSNAGLFITHQTIDDGDTVAVFTSETITVRVTLKEHVEGISVHSTSNRRIPGNDTVIYKSQFSTEPFTFIFSFYDTGANSVLLSAHRDDGSDTTDTIHLYVRSPLRQPDINGSFGSPVLIKTPPVGDRDVNYVWDFGMGSVFPSLSCSSHVTIDAASPSGIGELWVTDGVRRSPATLFNFALTDSSNPVIVCVNEGYIGADTIITSDSVFTLKARITDRGDGPVDSASINGKPFYLIVNNVYYALIDSMYRHPVGNPYTATVYALDHFTFENDTQKTFTKSIAIRPA